MERTKIDIISGFLGAGKTTLIKKLLNHQVTDGGTAARSNNGLFHFPVKLL